MSPNRQQTKTQTWDAKSYLALIFASLFWLTIITWISSTVLGSIAVSSVLIITTLLVLIGKYHQKAPSVVVAFSNIWLQHWKYSITMLVLAAVAISAGRGVRRDQQTLSVRPPATNQQAVQTIDQAVKEPGRAASQTVAETALIRFKSMNSAQHLDAARKALSVGYDHKERIGGELDEAEKHLAAIAPGSKEVKQRDKLENEIDARRKRTALVWYRETRKQIARDLDTLFIKQGINVDSVQAVGRDFTILRVNYVLCSRVFFDRMTPAEALETWRAKGFTRVECRTDDETISLDLK